MYNDPFAICHMCNWYQFITQSFIHTRVWFYVQFVHSTSPWESRPLLTWRPPAVTRVVLFSPRLLVNCPLVPHCSPLFPASLPSGLPQNPNVLLIRTHPNPSPSVANNGVRKFVMGGKNSSYLEHKLHFKSVFLSKTVYIFDKKLVFGHYTSVNLQR